MVQRRGSGGGFLCTRCTAAIGFGLVVRRKRVLSKRGRSSVLVAEARRTVAKSAGSNGDLGHGRYSVNAPRLLGKILSSFGPMRQLHRGKRRPTNGPELSARSAQRTQTPDQWVPMRGETGSCGGARKRSGNLGRADGKLEWAENEQWQPRRMAFFFFFFLPFMISFLFSYFKFKFESNVQCELRFTS